MKPNELFELIENSSYVKTGNSVDYRIIVDEVDEEIRLLFQETTDSIDWKTNLNFPIKLFKKNNSLLFIHKGYGDAWNSCHNEVVNKFLKAKTEFPHYKTQIAGWSYGGAMALLAAEDIYFRSGVKVDEIVTFGAPRPLFGIFTWNHFRKCAKKVYQYCLSYDFVSWLPFFYLRINTKIVDKKNAWKLWRVFDIAKYHTSYGNENYYK